MSTQTTPLTPLFSPEEAEQLHVIITDHGNDGFSLEELHGLFFGMALSPTEIPAEEWLPLVCTEEMITESNSQNGTLTSCLIEIHNRMVDEARAELLRFPFDTQTLSLDTIGPVQQWCSGLLSGLQLREDIWLDDPDEDDIDEDDDEGVHVALAILQGIAAPEEIGNLFVPVEGENDTEVPFDEETREEFLADALEDLPAIIADLQQFSTLLRSETLED